MVRDWQHILSSVRKTRKPSSLLCRKTLLWYQEKEEILPVQLHIADQMLKLPQSPLLETKEHSGHL